MKEATGELNTTVITVILVASLASFFYFTIWPTLQNNLNQNIGCSKAICPNIYRPDNSNLFYEDGTVDCDIYDSNGSKSTIRCPWKG